MTNPNVYESIYDNPYLVDLFKNSKKILRIWSNFLERRTNRKAVFLFAM